MSDELAIRQEVSPVIAAANSLTITNAEEYSYGTEFLKKIKETQKRVTDHFSPMKTKAHEAWKQVCFQENEVLVPLKNAEDTTKRKLINWKIEDDRKREEERRRLQAEADEKARIERDRLAKQAEKLKTPELKEQRLEQAQNIVAPIIEVQTAVPKVEGISVRKTWKAELTDKAVFIKAAANDPNLMALLTVDMSALNKIASATKGGVTYPGVRFYEETSMASRF